MITAATVAKWGQFGLPTDEELDLLERVIAGVIEHIEDYYSVSDPLTDAQEQAVLLQCSRLWRRRMSLDGVAAFNDFGPIRISSLDPDVQMLLERKFDFA